MGTFIIVTTLNSVSAIECGTPQRLWIVPVMMVDTDSWCLQRLSNQPKRDCRIETLEKGFGVSSSGNCRELIDSHACMHVLYSLAGEYRTTPQFHSSNRRAWCGATNGDGAGASPEPQIVIIKTRREFRFRIGVYPTTPRSTPTSVTSVPY